MSTNTVRIKRRISGNAGAPSTLKNAELAYNEIDNTLYYGKGDLGDGNASSIIAIAGSGVYATTAYVDSAISGADLASYAKLAASNTFAATYTNTFNGTVNIASTFQLGGTEVTATASELNVLDGITASTSELNVLDGVTASTAELNVLDGVTASTAELNVLDGVTASTAELNILDGVTADSTELNYLDGVTAGTAVASKAVVLDANKDFDFGTGDVSCAKVTTTDDVYVGGNLTVAGTTTTVDSVTVTVADKNIVLGTVETPTNSTADGGGVTVAAGNDGDKVLSWVLATGAWTSNQHFNLTPGRAYHIDGASVLSSTTLGASVVSSSLTSVGTIGTGTWQGTAVAVSYGGTGATTAENARANLGLAIGTNVQAYDAELAAIAGLSSAADRLPYFTGAGSAALATFTSFGRALVDDEDAATARATLNLGTMATQNADAVNITGGSISGITIDGGTF